MRALAPAIVTKWNWASGLLYLGVVVAWGLNYVFVRWGLEYSPPLWLAAGRAVVGLLGVAVVLVATRRLSALGGRQRWQAALIGIPSTAIFFGLWFTAAGSVPAGQAAVVVYTYPFWVAILSAGVMGYALRRVELAAILVGFGGVVLVSEPWAHAAGAPPLWAIVALLVGAFGWAAGTVAFKRLFTGPQVQEANLFQLLGGSIGLLASSAVLEPSGVAPTPELLGVLLWLGIVGTAFGYAAWYYLLDRFSAVTLSTYLFLVPVVALSASVILLGERLAPLQIAGVVLVLLSLYVTARTSAPAPSPAPEASDGAGLRSP